MLNVIEKDITTIDSGIIAHQVNCRGKMGSGIAGALRSKYPCIFAPYSKIIRSYIASGEKEPILGTVNLVPVSGTLRVANMFTQYDYGYDGGLYTNYDAIESAFKRLKMVNYKKLPVYIPYRYGSGLGGADWNVVLEAIESVYPEVIVCQRLEDK